MDSSRLWCTVAQGIVTEVCCPRIDIPQIRDLGFIVADDLGFWVELQRLGTFTVRLAAPGVPAVEVVHTHPRFTCTLHIYPPCLANTLAGSEMGAGSTRSGRKRNVAWSPGHDIVRTQPSWVAPIFDRTCQWATFPSSMWPRISWTSSH